jgi:hypothetical protein
MFKHMLTCTDVNKYSEIHAPTRNHGEIICAPTNSGKHCSPNRRCGVSTASSTSQHAGRPFCTHPTRKESAQSVSGVQLHPQKPHRSNLNPADVWRKIRTLPSTRRVRVVKGIGGVMRAKHAHTRASTPTKIMRAHDALVHV